MESDAVTTWKLLESGVELCTERNRILKGVVRKVIHESSCDAPSARVKFRDLFKYKEDMQIVIAAEGISTDQFMYYGR